MWNAIKVWWAKIESMPHWKEAVIEAAVVNGTYTEKDETDPVGAINRILAYAAHLAESPEANPKIASLHKQIAALTAELADWKAAFVARYGIADNWELQSSVPTTKAMWCDMIRAALAAGGIEPCAVPAYAPEDVAFGSERASDEELEHVYEQGREEGALVNMEGIRAVRSRVEAPLLAEIADMKIHCDGRDAQVKHLESATEKLHTTMSGLEDMVQRGNERWARVVGERESLRAQLQAATAERDAANERAEQAEAEAADLRCESSLIGELRTILGLSWCESITERCRELEALHPGETVEGVLMERDSLLIQLDHAKQDLAALRQPVGPDAWKTPLEMTAPNKHKIKIHGDGDAVSIENTAYMVNTTVGVVLAPADAARAAQWLASYAAAHGCPASGAIQYKRNPANDGFVNMPTDAQVEALARVLRDAHWEHHGLSKQDDAAPGFYSACARAAYDHIGRVPVGWEFDVTAEELAAKMWGFFDAEDMASKILDHCRSRIKPIYECKECANKEAEIDRVRNWNVNLNTTVEAVRAALENGGNE